MRLFIGLGWCLHPLPLTCSLIHAHPCNSQTPVFLPIFAQDATSTKYKGTPGPETKPQTLLTKPIQGPTKEVAAKRHKGGASASASLPLPSITSAIAVKQRTTAAAASARSDFMGGGSGRALAATRAESQAAARVGASPGSTTAPRETASASIAAPATVASASPAPGPVPLPAAVAVNTSPSALAPTDAPAAAITAALAAPAPAPAIAPEATATPADIPFPPSDFVPGAGGSPSDSDLDGDVPLRARLQLLYNKRQSEAPKMGIKKGMRGQRGKRVTQRVAAEVRSSDAEVEGALALTSSLPLSPLATATQAAAAGQQQQQHGDVHGEAASSLKELVVEQQADAGTQKVVQLSHLSLQCSDPSKNLSKNGQTSSPERVSQPHEPATATQQEEKLDTEHSIQEQHAAAATAATTLARDQQQQDQQQQEHRLQQQDGDEGALHQLQEQPDLKAGQCASQTIKEAATTQLSTLPSAPPSAPCSLPFLQHLQISLAPTAAAAPPPPPPPKVTQPAAPLPTGGTQACQNHAHDKLRVCQNDKPSILLKPNPALFQVKGRVRQQQPCLDRSADTARFWSGAKGDQQQQRPVSSETSKQTHPPTLCFTTLTAPHIRWSPSPRSHLVFHPPVRKAPPPCACCDSTALRLGDFCSLCFKQA